MTMAFALAKASFLCGIGAGFSTQNRTRLVGESHKTRLERFIFQTLSFFTSFIRIILPQFNIKVKTSARVRHVEVFKIKARSYHTLKIAPFVFIS